jgi:hypothetical protein
MINKVTALACEVTVTESCYLSYNPSEIAYASMLMALEMIPHEDLPIVQRHCFLLQMSTTAELDSKSELVIGAFEDLKETMNTSPKLQKLVDSLEKQRQRKPRETRILSSKFKSIPPYTNSPRQVMGG